MEDHKPMPHFFKKASFLQKLTLALSGWQDSNLRPPRPKRGAITGLRYTPKTTFVVNILKNRSCIPKEWRTCLPKPAFLCIICPLSLKLQRAKAERPGFEPGQHLRVDRLAICSITTLAPLHFSLKERLFFMAFIDK
jgi:hypothetical protein